MYYQVENPSFNTFGKGGNKVTIPRKVVTKVLTDNTYSGVEVTVQGHSYQFSKETLHDPDISGNKDVELFYGEFKGQRDYLDNYLISRSTFPYQAVEPVVEGGVEGLLQKIVEQNEAILNKMNKIYV